MEPQLTTPRTFTSWVREDGQRQLVEIPTRLPDREPADVPMGQEWQGRRAEPMQLRPYQEWAGNQAAKYTRDRIFQNNAAQWLRETIEALADQADFTAAVTLRDLCDEYDRKARGL